MNPARPCHDPYRTDAVLACMVDALHDLAGVAEAADDDSPRQLYDAMDLHALADAVSASVDRVALLGLLPLMGADEQYGAGLARIVTGKAKASDHNSGDRALAAVVAVRLATVAASIMVQGNRPSADASDLWAAAGRLTGLLTHAEEMLACAEDCMRQHVAVTSRLEVERDELRRELEKARANATDLRLELNARACESDGVREGMDQARRELAAVRRAEFGENNPYNP